VPAAVLVPVFRDAGGELRLVLVVRGARGVHGGQLALPGGKHEPGDRSLLETALRESEEEIGLGRADVELLAALEPLETRTTGFRVHPFLARCTGERRWRLSAGEIARVLTPPVAALAEPGLRRQQRIASPAGVRVAEAVLLDGEHLLWGLTLRLLDPLVPRLLAGEWPL
jgi:8-oxo-dGTP pyrophosphatase MutT (NUDIX family)